MTARPDSSRQPRLVRALGLWALTIYGVGDILGAGIYSLVGEVANLAGAYTTLAFISALAVAALTAGSYAELGSRFPHSSGEAYFCEIAFGRSEPALMIGWLVLCSGVVSMATVSHAFAGYMADIASTAPNWIWMVVFVAVLSGINFFGIRLTSRANIICTAIEGAGLLLVLILGGIYLFTRQDAPPAPAAQESDWMNVGQGAALAFFAFIGFEDMSKVSEEVRSPRRNIPLALLLALVVAGTIYVLVAVVATAVVPPAELAESQAPLTEVVRRAAPWFPVGAFSIIALFAVSNTALLNCVMASRLLYGMSQQRLLPQFLGAVHPVRKTPHWAIILVFFAALGLAASGSLAYLAETTSLLLLAVFLAVHLSLLRIKWRQVDRFAGFQVPVAIPLGGAISCAALAVNVSTQAATTAGVLALVGLGIIGIRHWFSWRGRA